MDIQSFFETFTAFYNRLFDLLATINITAFGVTVPWLFLVGSMIVVSMVVAYFWKGVRG